MQGLVYVVDDDDLLRQLLTVHLSNAGFEVTGFDSAEEFLNHPVCYTPSCILLDVTLSGMSGLDLQTHLNDREFAPPVIFLTSNTELRQAVHALRAGAFHFLTKPVDEKYIIKTVTEAIQHSKHESDFFAFLQKLTETEKKVAQLVRQGLLSKQIAEKLGISTRTIEWHRKNIATKGQIPTPHSLTKI